MEDFKSSLLGKLIEFFFKAQNILQVADLVSKDKILA